jgi:hypothetical protein
MAFDRNVPLDPALKNGVKGHNMNETTLPRSPALQGGELHIFIVAYFPMRTTVLLGLAR